MIVAENKLQTIQAQCRSFIFSGTYCQLKEYRDMTNAPFVIRPWVLLTYKFKTYRFTDPDLNVIISQLAHMYIKINKGLINEYNFNK